MREKEKAKHEPEWGIAMGDRKKELFGKKHEKNVGFFKER
jgi:hypothetical protein